MADVPGTPDGTTAGPARNGIGTAALVFGVLGFLLAIVVVGGLLGIVAIVLGIIGLSRVRRGEANNRGSAIAGIALGVSAVALTGILIVASATFISDNKEEFDNLNDCMNKATSDQDRQDCTNEFRDQIEGNNQ
jgi:ABC-type Fe3+-siderophore transport system permease subunit